MAKKRIRVFQMTGGRCFYCGCKLDLDTYHMDHFVAKAKGGKVVNNLVPACSDCNIYKGDSTIDEFREKIHECLLGNIKGRLIQKYYGVEDVPVSFFFEDVANGTIQNDINEFLDRQQGY